MGILRIALRTLLRHPSFSLIAALTLGLGLAATAAIFTVVYGVVLQPLPYGESEELVAIEHPVPAYSELPWGVSEAGWFELLDGNRSFEGIAVYETPTFIVGAEGMAEQVQAARVSANVFEVLGGGPAAGRLFTEADQRPGGPPVALLGHDFWRTRFGSDPGVVGTTLTVEGRPVEIVGVTAEGFDLPDGRSALWLPAEVSREKRPVNWHRFAAIGRLRDGVERAAAESDLRRIVATFPERLPQAYGGGFIERSGFDVVATPLRERVVGEASRSLWILLAAVGIVLAIGCGNVASLFLARLEAGRREHAVKRALGASRLDVLRGSLAESMMLVMAAAAIALLLTWWGLGVLLRLAPALPRVAEVGVGWQSLAFTIAVAGVVGVVFGALPALRSRVSMEALREGVGLTASRRRATVRGGLVVGEMALALVVLAGAGLMLRSFQNLRSVDPGIDAEDVLTAQIGLPASTYPDFGSVAEFHRRLAERTASLPGVTAVGATQQLPLTGRAGCSTIAVEDPAARDRNEGCYASTVQVTPGYFEAMGITVRGSSPTWDDMMASRGQVVVSEPLAARLWPGEPPSGQGVRGNGSEPPFYRVSGIAGPVRQNGLDEPAVERIYFPMLPMEGASLWGPPRDMTLVVRSAGTRPTLLAGPIREILSDLDPMVAMGEVRTLEEVVARSTARTTFMMLLLGIAAVVALALGVVGLYGTVSYAAEQRRSEIGIRVALGAGRGAVEGMVVRHAAVLAGLGVALGGLLALLATRVLASQLFEVRPTDPVTIVVASAVLVAVALAAAYLPARRASRVEPMSVLRGE